MQNEAGKVQKVRDASLELHTEDFFSRILRELSGTL